MSLQLIQQYYTRVDKIIQYGGSRHESALRFAFQTLLEQYCADKNLELIAELDYKTKSGATVYPDGTLKDAMRQDWGYWESKDQYDTLDEEIQKKFDKGYPKTNILFEDSQTAVLIQGGHEVARADIKNPTILHALLTAFVSYQPPEVQTFRAAIEKFKEDLPDLLAELRRVIEEQAASNSTFVKARDDFLELCKKAINPHLVLADIREMMIQHILTEDIFVTVFGEDQFHRENNIARELQQVISSFFQGTLRKNILSRISAYIDVIKAAASNISDHHEKQRFLKVVYENFYKTYNPAGADRLGIVYTPNEIVHFMIEAADYLVQQHFGRLLADEDVEILDPATGTGTFITELIEYLPKHRLPYKYQNEIHCNEVAILPYYVANLNIEYTYAQKMGHYAEFQNICFVDTLDNLGFGYTGKQYGFFDLSAENLDRIHRQNDRKISVIIGNPPYNANQLNENENNKNREYPGIDARIKDTYIKYSTAQKTKLYDMYSRFIRWAGDRLDKNGVIAFITNRSFVDARTFDGFRRVVADEFSHIYVVDLGGDVRKNPKLSGPKHNVFAIQTGVAISFLVKKQDLTGFKNLSGLKPPAQIYYIRRPEMETAREKLHFLATTKFKDLPFEHLQPDKNHNWINLADDNEWDELLPVGTKETKLGSRQVNAIFRLVSPSIKTNRDEWVYDFSLINLESKIKFLIRHYRDDLQKYSGQDVDNFVNYSIKWSSSLKNNLRAGLQVNDFSNDIIRRSVYRPYVRIYYYADKFFSDRLTNNHFEIWGNNLSEENIVINFSDANSNKPFHALVQDIICDYHFVADTQCLPLYRYGADGTRLDNITDWALAQFRARYGSPSPQPSPTGRGSSGDSPLPLGEGLGVRVIPSGQELGVEVTSPKIKPPLPPKLLARARELRQSATDAEKLLWQLLRNRQLEGVKFRRQHPFGNFILDFYCHEAKLVIELDGGGHAEPAQVQYDAARTQALEAEGIRVLRFWNNDVLRNTTGVLEAIWDVVSSLTPTTLTPPEPPSPQPSPTGRGSSGDSPLPLGEGLGVREITKRDIFHYVYAVLHHPVYRQKYELNLKRDFPRIPFYEDFWQWAGWGQTLMQLHLNYETAVPYPLQRVDTLSLSEGLGGVKPPVIPKAKLKADKTAGTIELDTVTTLKGVPAVAWQYKLGHRSALEWVLEYHKERTPKDPTIRDKFNTYHLADYKEQVIDLLQRVCTVSIETMKIIKEMSEA